MPRAHRHRLLRSLLFSLWLTSLLPACQSSGSSPAESGSRSPDGNGVEPISANPNANSPSQPLAQQPNGPAVLYHGRFDTVTDPNVPTSSWPGSEMIFGFRGTQLTVTLAAPDPATYNGVAQAIYMAYAVDGGVAQTIQLQSAKTAYALAQNLTGGQHTVRLSKMTEGQMGRVMYYGASTDGALTYTPPASGRRIEFIGDSGTAGYGTLGTFPCTFSAATENADVAYPAVVGRLLNAEARNLSYSGKGLIQNRDTVNDAYKTLPILWQRTLPLDDPYLIWDTNQWQPQAVVAIVSGNDVYTSVPTQDVFTSKIGAFAKQLRAAYPSAVLLFGVSPMLRTNDPHVGQRVAAITYLQNAITAAADPNVAYVDLPQDNGFNGSNCATTGCAQTDPNCLGGCMGCDDHMIPLTQSLVANAIAAAIKTKLGW